MTTMTLFIFVMSLFLFCIAIGTWMGCYLTNTHLIKDVVSDIKRMRKDH